MRPGTRKYSRMAAGERYEVPGGLPPVHPSNIGPLPPHAAEDTLPVYQGEPPRRARSRGYGTRRPHVYLKVSGAARYAKIDARDYGRCSGITWCTDANGYVQGHWRRSIGGDGRTVQLHVFVLGRREGYVIDHMDGNKRNCTRANLRHALRSQNARNRSANKMSESGIRGVTRHRDHWRVQYNNHAIPVFLGSFHTVDEARPVANLGIALLYGRGTRLADGKPFDDSHVAGIVAAAAVLGERRLLRILSETAGHGDDLSARLRLELLSHVAAQHQAAMAPSLAQTRDVAG